VKVELVNFSVIGGNAFKNCSSLEYISLSYESLRKFSHTALIGTTELELIEFTFLYPENFSGDSVSDVVALLCPAIISLRPVEPEIRGWQNEDWSEYISCPLTNSFAKSDLLSRTCEYDQTAVIGETELLGKGGHIMATSYFPECVIGTDSMIFERSLVLSKSESFPMSSDLVRSNLITQSKTISGSHNPLSESKFSNTSFFDAESSDISFSDNVEKTMNWKWMSELIQTNDFDESDSGFSESSCSRTGNEHGETKGKSQSDIFFETNENDETDLYSRESSVFESERISLDKSCIFWSETNQISESEVFLVGTDWRSEKNVMSLSICFDSSYKLSESRMNSESILYSETGPFSLGKLSRSSFLSLPVIKEVSESEVLYKPVISEETHERHLTSTSFGGDSAFSYTRVFTLGILDSVDTGSRDQSHQTRTSELSINQSGVFHLTREVTEGSELNVSDFFGATDGIFTNTEIYVTDELMKKSILVSGSVMITESLLFSKTADIIDSNRGFTGKEVESEMFSFNGSNIETFGEGTMKAVTEKKKTRVRAISWLEYVILFASVIAAVLVYENVMMKEYWVITQRNPPFEEDDLSSE
jgi:hypothetical protein